MEFLSGYAYLCHGSEAVFPAVHTLAVYKSGQFPCDYGKKQQRRDKPEYGGTGYAADAHIHPNDGIGHRGNAHFVHLSHVPALFCEGDYDRFG